ncbi:putative mitochondrial inner membrane metallopeptidase Oma1 [Aspergillus ellipticus CBS 707.79]|uniref:Putative mitochondrial inner membrane metallopeptidase Oma1 n=1 Tax=Aspergillus ellipticus CBS 707.79 TaxID=1448320 RepID=A0A319E7R5_9EURO|nr:putative mitochondrial inner membrane metallopeptidase Oma1 [Aspergillus ellipticus CBS 707.79]
MFRLPLVRALFRASPRPVTAPSFFSSHTRSVSPSIRSISWRTCAPRSSTLDSPTRAFRSLQPNPFANAPRRTIGRATKYRRFQNGSRKEPLWLFLVRKSKFEHYVIIGVLVGGFYVYNIETVEMTGRRRFNCIPASWELRMGETTYAQTLQQVRGKILPDYHPLTIHVSQVLARLIPEAPIDGANWKVHVIDDPREKNAFVLPGGKVFVYTGILPICKDDDGLAAVLGHEIAHVVAHHTAERLSLSYIGFAAVGAAVFLFDFSGQLSTLFYNLFFELPHSRTQELEADTMGLMMMAKACYNPEAAAQLWERMHIEEGGSAPPQILSTHPASPNRRDAIREILHKADAIFEDNGCHSVRGFLPHFYESSRSLGR